MYPYGSARESSQQDVDRDYGEVYSDALLAVSLPFILWGMFFLRAVQFYNVVREAGREAETDAEERSRSLATMVVPVSEGNVSDGQGGSGHGNVIGSVSVIGNVSGGKWE